MQSASRVEREYMGGIENSVLFLYVARVAKYWGYTDRASSPAYRENTDT
jgi:hypothetical protein